MKKGNSRIIFGMFMCFILCMAAMIYTCPVTAMAKPEAEKEPEGTANTEINIDAAAETEIVADIDGKIITLIKRLSLEEARELAEPSKEYQDENGTLYLLSNWELEEKAGEEKRIPMEKQVRYLELEDGEEIPESIYGEISVSSNEAAENPASRTLSETEKQTGSNNQQLSGILYKAEAATIAEQWKDDLYLPVTFYSYGADEYQLGEVTVSAGTTDLLKETAQNGQLLLNSLGLSDQAYHITSVIWNGEPFTDENGQICRNAIALGERFLKDVEVLYKGEAIFKEPDFYELHAIYRAEEKEEDSSVEFKPSAAPEPPAPLQKQGPFWYLIRTGFVITITVGVLGILIGSILLILAKRRRKEEKDHF